MKYELLFSGIGGQGVITLGETLCDAAIKAGLLGLIILFYCIQCLLGLLRLQLHYLDLL